MVRLIDADALIEDAFNLMDRDELLEDVPQIIKDYCDAQPTIDAEPVRHGKWIPISSNNKWFDVSKCSVCGKQYSLYPLDYNYCPHCGAKMDAERKEE